MQSFKIPSLILSLASIAVNFSIIFHPGYLCKEPKARQQNGLYPSLTSSMTSVADSTSNSDYLRELQTKKKNYSRKLSKW